MRMRMVRGIISKPYGGLTVSQKLSNTPCAWTPHLHHQSRGRNSCPCVAAVSPRARTAELDPEPEQSRQSLFPLPRVQTTSLREAPRQSRSQEWDSRTRIYHRIRSSLSRSHVCATQGNLRTSSMASFGVQGRLPDSKDPCRPLSEHRRPSSVTTVGPWLSRAWPAHSLTPSRTENKECPKPNCKRQNSVGQTMTLNLNWHFSPRKDLFKIHWWMTQPTPRPNSNYPQAIHTAGASELFELYIL